MRCDACGHLQLVAMPAEADLREAYGKVAGHDYLAEEAGQRRTARAVLARIDAHVLQRGERPRRLLDLGCWVGFLLDVRTADLLGADLPERAFDAIVLGDVLEHLPHPAAALDRVATLLAPGGRLAVMLPDAGSRTARLLGRRWWSIIPTHVHHFTRHSLTTLLRSRGFAPLEVRTQPKALSAGYYAARLNGSSPRLGAALVRGLERAGLAGRLVAPDFRDRMLVIARHA